MLFSGLTMNNGLLTGGSDGGGLLISGRGAHNVTLQNCTVSGNTVDAFGGGISNQSSASTLNIIGSTVSGNISTGVNSGGAGSGAALDSVGTLNITNSTFSGNSANSGSSNSGALWNNGATTILNSTFSNNTAVGSGSAGAIYVFGGTVTLKNTLLAGNTNAGGGADLRKGSGGNFATQGFNLVGDNSTVTAFFPAGLPNANGDYVGTSVSPINPQLGPLANYGGTTQTHALLAGSPAIDTGTNAGSPTTDQRGRTRPYNTTTDIGAYEINPSLTLPPTTLANGTQNTPYSASLNNPSGGTAPYNFVVIAAACPLASCSRRWECFPARRRSLALSISQCWRRTPPAYKASRATH